MQKNKYLLYIFVDKCNIDDIGTTYINKVFKNNHILKTLSLNNNYLTMKSIPALIFTTEKY